MSNRMKSGLIVVATLLLGFLLGVVVVGSLHRRRIAHLREFNDRGGVASVIRRQVRPRPEQRAPLREILKQYEPRLRQMRESHREEMERVLDSLADELGAVLTPAQMRRLRRHGPAVPQEPGIEPGRGRREGRGAGGGAERRRPRRERSGEVPPDKPPPPPLPPAE